LQRIIDYTYECHQSGLRWFPRRCFVAQGGPSLQASCTRGGDGGRLSDRSFQQFFSLPQRQPERIAGCLSLGLLQTLKKNSDGVKIRFILCCCEESTDLHNFFFFFFKVFRCASPCSQRCFTVSQRSLSFSSSFWLH